MATILVPAPPASAFNKNRPVSDLLRGQLRHFHHVEASLPLALRSNMGPRDVLTENGAARYIAHITNALESIKQVPAPIPIRRRPAAPPIAIAAAAESPKTPRKTRAAKTAAKQPDRKTSGSTGRKKKP